MTTVTPQNVGQLLADARRARQTGDVPALARLADALLAYQPHEPRFLVLKGDALHAGGDLRSATTFYGAAVARVQGATQLPPDLRADIEHALRRQAEAAALFEARLRDGLRERGFDAADPDQSRFAAAVDLMTGRRRLYYQQPKFFLFPGLPQIEFQPRATVPWLAQVEEATADIKAELQGLLARPELFAPYIEDRKNRPASDQAGLLGNDDWSAVFLWKDGIEVPEIAALCPRTLQALSGLPLCRIPGRSPSILFSRLKAGAKIPPHTGLINTRLICHLPLVVPDGCYFRVGNEERQWREGQAWAFDDTIEHEARNDSAQDRTILIFDVWKPEITPAERQKICDLFATIDAAGGSNIKLGV